MVFFLTIELGADCNSKSLSSTEIILFMLWMQCAIRVSIICKISLVLNTKSNIMQKMIHFVSALIYSELFFKIACNTFSREAEFWGCQSLTSSEKVSYFSTNQKPFLRESAFWGFQKFHHKFEIWLGKIVYKTFTEYPLYFLELAKDNTSRAEIWHGYFYTQKELDKVGV